MENNAQLKSEESTVASPNPTPIVPAAEQLAQQSGVWMSREEYDRLRFGHSDTDTVSPQELMRSQARVGDAKHLSRFSKDFWTYAVAALAFLIFFALTAGDSSFFNSIFLFAIAIFSIMAIVSLVRGPSSTKATRSAGKVVTTVLISLMMIPLIPAAFFFLMVLSWSASGQRGS